MEAGFKLAACQMNVVDDKDRNISKAVEMLKTAADNGARMVILPEMFNCPYSNGKFPEYAEEEENSPTLDTISKAASSLGIYIIAGSIPEARSGKLFNTCFIFNKKGEIIGKHRKMHLFDIDIPGKITFKESDMLSSGAKVTVVDTEYCKVGVAICYDVRFPELSRLMALKGAELIVIPGAFNMTTGPAHWELLMRTRALDNQVYFAAVSPARDLNASYTAYGNSMVVEPWGNIACRAGEAEEVIICDIDLSKVGKVRSELPLLKHRRTDIYEIVEK